MPPASPPTSELFRSTLPRRERLAIDNRRAYECEFRSTLPRRERRTSASRARHSRMFRSTLPRRERPGKKRHRTCISYVSIHAPAKGATPPMDIYSEGLTRFDPRSREGSDSMPSSRMARSASFRSTLPRRERLALAKQFGDHGLFRSTLPRRERQVARRVVISFQQFRSTLPRRERLWMDTSADPKLLFRSTLPRRERPGGEAVDASPYGVSIHAPAKGATGRVRRSVLGADVSIHAPAKGATAHAGARRRGQAVSIHAPAKGATRGSRCCGRGGSWFRSTLPRRERLTVAPLDQA